MQVDPLCRRYVWCQLAEHHHGHCRGQRCGCIGYLDVQIVTCGYHREV